MWVGSQTFAKWNVLAGTKDHFSSPVEHLPSECSVAE